MEYQNAADILPEDYLTEKRQAYNVSRKSKFYLLLEFMIISDTAVII